jgi:DNA-binding HxlR family transcriptional regulator
MKIVLNPGGKGRWQRNKNTIALYRKREIMYEKTRFVCFVLSNENRLLILREISLSDGKRWGYLRNKFNLNNNTLTFHLNALLKAKMIVKENKKYIITDFGSSSLDFVTELDRIGRG